jgi:hypothetical protein
MRHVECRWWSSCASGGTSDRRREGSTALALCTPRPSTCPKPLPRSRGECVLTCPNGCLSTCPRPLSQSRAHPRMRVHVVALLVCCQPSFRGRLPLARCQQCVKRIDLIAACGPTTWRCGGDGRVFVGQRLTQHACVRCVCERESWCGNTSHSTPGNN